MKLVELAQKCISLIKECGDEGIRSDIIALTIGVPKRRVYDVIAVLRALGLVRTRRRQDGTTVYWIDRSEEFVPMKDYEALLEAERRVTEERNELQVRVAELKEQVRMLRSRLRHDAAVGQATGKTQFDTTTLTVRALSKRGFKRVRDSGVEVIIETYEPGIVVDPVPRESSETRELLRSLQRI